MSGTTIAKPMETLIRQKLTQALDPQHLAIFNESYMHNVPKGSESHFKVVVISDKFEKETLIKRHRMVNEVLQEELRSGLHALSIVVYDLVPKNPRFDYPNFWLSELDSVPIGSDNRGSTVIESVQVIPEIMAQIVSNFQRDDHCLAMTLSQWENSDKMAKPSPACRGGFGR